MDSSKQTIRETRANFDAKLRQPIDPALAKTGLAGMMDILGQPQHVGCCFAFNRGDHPPETWPAPAYEHRIYSDGVTDYYIAVRPNAEGDYEEYSDMLKGMKRLR